MIEYMILQINLLYIMHHKMHILIYVLLQVNHFSMKIDVLEEQFMQ